MTRKQFRVIFFAYSLNKKNDRELTCRFKCFHNGIILIVISLQFVVQIYNYFCILVHDFLIKQSKQYENRIRTGSGDE